MYHSQDMARASSAPEVDFLRVFQPHLSMQGAFLANGASFSRDILPAYTIEHGLSSGTSESTSLSHVFAWHFLRVGEGMSTSIRQFSRISAWYDLGVSLIGKSASRCIENCFQKFVGFETGQKKHVEKICLFVKKSHSNKNFGWRFSIANHHKYSFYDQLPLIEVHSGILSRSMPMGLQLTVVCWDSADASKTLATTRHQGTAFSTVVLPSFTCILIGTRLATDQTHRLKHTRGRTNNAQEMSRTTSSPLHIHRSLWTMQYISIISEQRLDRASDEYDRPSHRRLTRVSTDRSQQMS